MDSTSIFISYSWYDSEYPNIPDNEFDCFFERINFTVNMSGININIYAKGRDHGDVIAMIYPRVISIEENTMRSSIHSKYYFRCENALKKQRYNELINTNPKKYQELNDEDQDLITFGYIDTYKLTVHFSLINEAI